MTTDKVVKRTTEAAPGVIHHICIQTNCYEESLDFYTTVLGFEVVKATPDFHSRAMNTWLKLGAFYIELQTPKAGETLKPWSSANAGPVHLCFVVADLQKEFWRLKNAGCCFKVKDGQELYTVENGQLCKVKAPEGTEIELRDNPEI